MIFASYAKAPECETCKHAPTNHYHRAIYDLNGKFQYITISQEHYDRYLRESTELRNRMPSTATLTECFKAWMIAVHEKYLKQ